MLRRVAAIMQKAVAAAGITVVGSPLSGSKADGTDVTINLPALSQNDVVYVGFACQTDTFPSTSGYTQVASSTPTNLFVRVYRKKMDASPDTTVTIFGSSSDNGFLAVVGICLRGVNTGTQEDAAATNANGASGVPNSPSITTVTDNAMVISLGGSWSDDGTITPPTGYSNLAVSHGQASGGAPDAMTVALSTKIVSPAAAENPAVYTNWDSTGVAWGAVSIAVRPA